MPLEQQTPFELQDDIEVDEEAGSDDPTDVVATSVKRKRKYFKRLRKFLRKVFYIKKGSKLYLATVILLSAMQFISGTVHVIVHTIIPHYYHHDSNNKRNALTIFSF